MFVAAADSVWRCCCVLLVLHCHCIEWTRPPDWWLVSHRRLQFDVFLPCWSVGWPVLSTVFYREHSVTVVSTVLPLRALLPPRVLYCHLSAILPPWALYCHIIFGWSILPNCPAVMFSKINMQIMSTWHLLLQTLGQCSMFCCLLSIYSKWIRIQSLPTCYSANCVYTDDPLWPGIYWGRIHQPSLR